MERHLAFLVECRGAFSSLNELKVWIFSFLFLKHGWAHYLFLILWSLILWYLLNRNFKKKNLIYVSALCFLITWHYLLPLWSSSSWIFVHYAVLIYRIILKQFIGLYSKHWIYRWSHPNITQSTCCLENYVFQKRNSINSVEAEGFLRIFWYLKTFMFRAS